MYSYLHIYIYVIKLSQITIPFVKEQVLLFAFGILKEIKARMQNNNVNLFLLSSPCYLFRHFGGRRTRTSLILALMLMAGRIFAGNVYSQKQFKSN